MTTTKSKADLGLIAHLLRRAGFGATLGPCVIMSLYSPKTTKQSAILGMLVGTITVIAWGALEGGLFDMYALLPGFTSGLIAIFLTNAFCQKD